MRGIFVSGTDTGVGKTLVSACLMAAAPDTTRYWKPVQTGMAEGDNDTQEILRLTGLDADRALDVGVRLGEPASPHHAAALEGVRVSLAEVAAMAPRLAAWVVEGAGGLLSPLADDGDTLDLVTALAPAAVVLIADAGLGTINLVRLSCAALGTDRTVIVYLNRFEIGRAHV